MLMTEYNDSVLHRPKSRSRAQDSSSYTPQSGTIALVMVMKFVICLKISEKGTIHFESFTSMTILNIKWLEAYFRAKLNASTNCTSNGSITHLAINVQADMQTEKFQPVREKKWSM